VKLTGYCLSVKYRSQNGFYLYFEVPAEPLEQ